MEVTAAPAVVIPAVVIPVVVIPVVEGVGATAVTIPVEATVAGQKVRPPVAELAVGILSMLRLILRRPPSLIGVCGCRI